MTFQSNKALRLMLFVFLVSFMPVLLFGGTADTIRLLYNINQYQLSDSNKIKLNIVKSKILSRSCKVAVIGYADYLGNSKPNLTLSFNRARAVKMYLLGLHVNVKIAVKAEGQVEYPYKKSESGNAPDRKVEIIIENDAINTPKIISKTADTLLRKITPDKNTGIKRITKKSAFQRNIDSLSTLNIGSSLTVKELVFLPGRHILMTRSLPYLDSLVDYFREHKNLVFKIVGHVCCDFEYRDGYDLDGRRYDLSVERARSICAYFLENGISSSRMKYEGLGSTAPKVFPEKTVKDEELNRRVEIVIEGK